MKKILIITSLFPSQLDPTYGNFIYDQVTLLSKHFDIHVIIEKQTWISKKLFIKTFLKQISSFFSKEIVENKEYPFKTYCLLYKSFTFYSIYKIQFYYAQNHLFRLLKEIEQRENWKPDLIHAYYTQNSGVFANYLSKKLTIPYIISEHNSLNFGTSTFWAKLYKIAYLESNTFCVVSDHECQKLLSYNPHKDIKLLHNFINEELFVANNNIFEKHTNIFTVLYIGYPHPLKGMKLLFEIINIIKLKEVENIIFLIVSSDDSTEQFPQGISNYIIEKQLSSYCQLIPRLPNEKIHELYKQANVLLSTSINETFGMCLLEGVLSGIPIISTKCGGPEEFLNSCNSLLFSLNDLKGIVDGILKIKNSEIIFERIKIQKSVLNKYSAKNFISEINSIYEQST